MQDDSRESPETGGLEGRYANYFHVGYNAFEFVLGFGQFYAGWVGTGPACLHTKIVTSPVYAKALWETLRESLDRYERSFGPIPQLGEAERETR